MGVDLEADCDGDGVPDAICIDTWRMARWMVRGAGGPNGCEVEERVLTEDCPNSMFDEWTFGDSFAWPGGRNICASAADPHMSMQNGGPWEFQNDHGDYVMFSLEPNARHNPLTLVSRFEEYNCPSTAGFQGLTAA